MPTITNMGEANNMVRKVAKAHWNVFKMMIGHAKQPGDYVQLDAAMAPGKYKISFGMDSAGHEQVTFTPGTE